MKQLLLVSIVFASAIRVVAAPLQPESRISAVTVYTDRAVITRTAAIEVAEPGMKELQFERLPAALLDESLQVAARGSARATVLDVTARTTFVEFAPNERVKAIETQLQALTRQERELQNRADVLNQQRAYVLRIQQATTTPPTEAAAPLPTTENWLRLLAFSEEQLTKLAGESQGIEAQREELKDRRAALEQQLGELRGEPNRSLKAVFVRLEFATAGRLEVTFRYTVPAASWSPSYDARVLSADRAVQLGYFGIVRQNTGEDWSGVELTLSTARPAMGGEPPELSPWVVAQQEVRPLALEMPLAASARMQKSRAPLAEDAVQFSAFEGAGANEPVEAKFSQAAVESQATSASFRIAVPADVPSDNSPQKVPITTARLASTPEYVAAPKQIPAAFLNAHVTHASDYPLLAGPMNVFLDDTFVAASRIRTVMPNEKFELALGVDEGISVKRRLNNRLTEDTGLMTKSRRITYDFTLTLQNNKKSAEKIVIRDQVPISRHEKIVVKLLAPDEREVKPDAEGVLKWTLTLNPGEKRELPLKFSVEHPVDMVVTGLE